MKKYFFIFLVPFFLLSCQEERDVVIEEYHATGNKKIEREYGIKSGKLLFESIYYDNGQKMSEGSFKNDKREGRWTYWYINGLKWSETTYKNGLEHGIHSNWYENGQKRYEGLMQNGEKQGKWSIWDESGKLIEEKDY